MISTADLERRLQALAAAVEWPQEADLARAVVLPSRRRPLWARPQVRVALALVAALVVAFSTVLVASPATRSAVARLLGFPGVAVEVGTEPLPTASGIDLGSAMTVTEAQVLVDFPLRTLALPDPQVSYDAGTRAVHIRYRGQGGPVLLTQLRGNADLGFVKQARGIKPTMVGGDFALWATGPDHALLRTEDGRVLQAQLSANALLWSQERVTYRLETDSGLEAAVRLAESLR